jgi:hypothetical protein
MDVIPVAGFGTPQAQGEYHIPAEYGSDQQAARRNGLAYDDTVCLS